MSILPSESSEPVTKRDQLMDYFARGEKSKERWLIGVQHEKFPYRLSSLSWPAYEEPQGLREFMQGMRPFGWEPIMEGGNIIGLTRGKAAM